MPGSRACVRVVVRPGWVGRAGIPGAFWCASPFPLAALSFRFAWPPPGWSCPFLGPLFALPPPFRFFFSLLCCFFPRAPFVSFFLWVPAPPALGLGAVCCLFYWPRASWLSVRSRLFCVARVAVGCSLVVAPPPPFVSRGFCCRRSVPCIFFSPLVCAPVVSGLLWFPAPGALGLGAVLCVFFCLPLLGSPCAFTCFVPSAWPLAAPWWLLPQPPPSLFVSRGFRRCRSVPGFFFFSSCVRPRCLWLSVASGPGRPGPWRCVLFVLWASRCPALCALSSRLCVPPARWLLPGDCCPPPSPSFVSRGFRGCRSVLCSFLFPALCAPVVPGFLWFPALGALGLGAVRCLLCWPPAPRLSVRSRLFRASRLAVGCSLVVAAPPPPFVSCGFHRCGSVLCAVCCAVLCVPGCGAAPRCCALCRLVLCCSVLCCFVALVWCRCLLCCALWRCPLPWGPVLCGAVFCGVPQRGVLCAVCVLFWRGGARCCSPLCFVLCVSWGAVLCVPCPLRSVRCCASLCCCACVVLFVWCVLLLPPGAVVRCCVLCCFFWCAVVRCWVWWPVVVSWWRVLVSLSLSGRVVCFPVVGVVCCGALLPCVVFCGALLSRGAVLLCLLSFCGTVGACFAPLWPVVLCCAVLLVGCAIFCPVVVSACCGAFFLMLCVPCLLRSVRCCALLCWLWCPASLPCAVTLCCRVVLCCRALLSFCGVVCACFALLWPVVRRRAVVCCAVGCLCCLLLGGGICVLWCPFPPCRHARKTSIIALCYAASVSVSVVHVVEESGLFVRCCRLVCRRLSSWRCPCLSSSGLGSPAARRRAKMARVG